MKQLFLKLSLSAKASSLAFALCAITGLVLVFTAMQASRTLIFDSAEHHARSNLEILVAEAAVELSKQDLIALQSLLRAHSNNDVIAGAAIYDPSERPLAEAGDTTPRRWQLRAAIGSEQQGLGEAVLYLDRDALGSELAVLRSVLLILALLLAALAFALVSSFSKQIEHWLNEARRALLDQPGSGSVDYPGDDALGELLKAIHEPAVDLERGGELNRQQLILVQVEWLAYERLQEQMDPLSLKAQREQAYRIANALSRLYRAELRVSKAKGLSLLIPRGDGAQGLLHAVCCAWLIEQSCSALESHTRIGEFDDQGSRWQLDAAINEACLELAAIDDSHSGSVLRLGEESLQTLAKLVEYETIEGVDMQRLSAIKEPYKNQVDKQLAVLRKPS